MHILFNLLIILRLYLAGLAFSFLCFYTGRKNPYAVSAGAFSYIFCDFALRFALKHPFFLNPLIYLPLMISGIEKILKEKKPVLFIIITAVSAVSNIYFFYMISALTFLYALIRLLLLYKKDVEGFLKSALKICAAYITGVMISGFMLLPAIAALLNDSRISVHIAHNFFYPALYYSALPLTLLSVFNNDYYLSIGLSSAVIAAVFLLFYKSKKTKDIFLRILLSSGLIILLIPDACRVFNAFQYPYNRWIFGFILLCCYILTYKWNDLINITKPKALYLLSCIFVLGIMCGLFEKSREPEAFFALGLLSAMAAALYFLKNKRQKTAAVLIITFFSVLSFSLFRYNPEIGIFNSRTVKAEVIKNHFLNNEASGLRKLSDGFIRYSGRGISMNAGMLEKVSSSAYYWSISNSFINKFRADLEMRGERIHQYFGYDDRAALLALSSVNYFIKPLNDEMNAPFGFEKIGEIKTAESVLDEKYVSIRNSLDPEFVTNIYNEYSVYKNKYALPLGFVYDRYISDETWRKLPAVQKQQIMLDAVYLKEKPENISEFKQLPIEHNLKYTIEENGAVSYEDGKITVLEEGAAIVLKFKGLENSETYIEFKGLEYKGKPEYILKGEPMHKALILFNSKNCRNKTLLYRTDFDRNSSGRKNYIVNLMYDKEAIEEAEIIFTRTGVYTFDELNVIAVSFDNYEEKIERLKANVLENIKFGVNSLSGTINADEPEILCITVPYSEGFKAYIDGKPARIYTADGRYIGLELDKGKHKIELKYSSPYKKEGIMLSVFGIIILCGYLMYCRCLLLQH